MMFGIAFGTAVGIGAACTRKGLRFVWQTGAGLHSLDNYGIGRNGR